MASHPCETPGMPPRVPSFSPFSARSWAEAPGMAAYENAAYPNRLVIPVPGLAAGKVFSHALPFWKGLDWQPGNYNFVLEADAGKTVAETNEGNNFGGAVLSKP